MEAGTLVTSRFRVIELAGTGGFGSVYRAVDESSGREVALKIFDRKHADQLRFEREASLLSQLRHPQIVEFIAHGLTEQGTAYIAMEWLTGRDLEQRLRDQGPLSQAESLALALRAAQGLASAHAQGLVHRDVKPSNIFLVAGMADQAKLLDFGIARREDDDAKLTRTGAVIGTPGYMAPEQAAGARELSPRVDIFALGCVLFECLTGEQAFVGTDARAVLARTMSDPAPRLAHWMPNAAVGLDALLARMMARDPFARFPDGSALALALSDVIANPDSADFARRGVAAVSSRALRNVSRLVVVGTQQSAEAAVGPACAFGAELEQREGGSVALRFGLDNATETARRAVLCALELVAADGSLGFVVLSSRDAAPIASPLALVENPALDGLVPERGRVLVDGPTAHLLGRAFVLSNQTGASWVSAAPQAPHRRSTGVHLGRARELATLDGILAEVMDESCARLVLVSGEAGLGKSQLLETFVARLEARDGHCALFWAQADAPTGASPFELSRAFVRERHRALLAADPSGQQLVDALRAQGMGDVDARSLLELVVPTLADPTLPNDPLLVADRMRLAWLSFIELELGKSPLLLVAEDVHLADVASLKLLTAAVSQLSDRALMILASTRSTNEELLAAQAPERLVLSPFRPQLAAELVRALQPDLQQAQVDAIVQRAAGNPLRLRELARASAAGRGEQEIDAAFDARVAELPGGAARAVRAGSVFGQRFAEAAVKCLVGDALSEEQLSRSLAFAVQAGVLRSGGDSQEPSYTFAHALLQECAYAQLPELDLKAAHRAAGAWLADQAGANPSIVAWHFERAGEPALALPWFEAAVRAALVGGEPARALALTEAALLHVRDPEQLARIAVLRAEAALAQADLQEAQRSAELGMQRARPGSLTWVRAAATAVSAAGQGGQNDTVLALGQRVLTVTADPDAQAVRVICLCQLTTQLVGAGRFVESEEFAAAAARESSTRPEAQAGVAHVAASYAFRVPDYELAAEKTGESARLHALAGNLRASALLRVFRASALLYAGDPAAAEQELAAAEGLARRTGADYYVRWASYTRGKILAVFGDPWAAREHLQTVREQLAGSPRIVAGTHIYTALAALRTSDAAWAERSAQAALSAHSSLTINAVASAILARATVQSGDPARAVALAEQASSLLAQAGGIEENENSIHLAHIEALEAAGRHDEAKPLASAALERLLAAAARISTLSRREAYLNAIEPHAATLRAAHRLGLPWPRY